jgi:PAS domain S-box-containing protein
MSSNPKSTVQASPDWLTGGGEMGALMRALDWSQTPLGPLDSWSPTLKTMTRFLLVNRFPILLWWGPQFCQLYNDAYRPILGTKHPQFLGRPTAECWAEIWHILRPLIETPFNGGPATWMEDIQLELNRYGFTEETHFTIAYSPVPDDTVASGIGGVIATVHEISEKVVGERRIVVLRDLGTRAIEAKTAEEACAVAATTLDRHSKDVPFALLYLIDNDAKQMRLAGAAGISAGTSLSPLTIDPEREQPWPLSHALQTETAQTVDDLAARFEANVPPGPWSDPPREAVVTLIRSNVPHQPAGVLIAGVSSRLRLDDSYLSFIELAATQIATAIANARAYEEERKRAEALAEIDRAKIAFFSNVSHEFRTPLTLMLGPLQDVMGEPFLPQDVHERLSLAHRNSLRLLKLVNTLLDFSRIEADRIEAVYEPVDLSALTTELASNFRSAIECAGLSFTVDCEPLPEDVFVDRDMWEKIVLNLLSNAFKFTLDGGIKVELRQAGEMVELSVIDTGTGIPAEALPRIFERFHRVKGARGRSYEGSGIGLALVQELVKLHGGNVSVQSELDRGTTFTVSIPLGKAHLPAERIGAERQLPSTGLRGQSYVDEALRWLQTNGDATETSDLPVIPPARVSTKPRKKVLLADDNADMRDYVHRLLSSEYEVIEVDDGAAALLAAREHEPDLVLADVMMPELDGFGLLNALRADERLQSIPVVMLSARAGEDSRVEGLEAGADDYLVKPFAARELLARVGSSISLAQMRNERRQAERGRERAEARNLFLVQLDDALRPLDDPEQITVTAEHILGRHLHVDRCAYVDTHTRAIEDLTEIQSGVCVPLYKRGKFVAGMAVYMRMPRNWTTDELELVRLVTARCWESIERARVARELRESETLYRAFVTASSDAVYRMSADWKEMRQLEGREFIAGTDRPNVNWLQEYIHPDDQQRVLSAINLAIRTRAKFELEHRVLRRDGSLGWTVSRAIPILDDKGEIREWLGTASDVTRRKEAEEALRESEEKYRTVLGSMDEGLMIAEVMFDETGKQAIDYLVLETNEAFYKHTGLPLGMVGKTIREIVVGDEVPWLGIYGDVALSGEATRFEYEITVEPLVGWYDIFIQRIGEPHQHRVAVMFQDITERKRVEESIASLVDQLRDQDRRKDEFLATLAHELRNPLAPMNNGLQLMRLAASNPATLEHARAMMERQLQQMKRLVDDLMDVSRISRNKLELRKEFVELATVVNRATETSRPLIEAAEQELLVSLPTEPVLIDGDPVRLAQAFSNLLNNASKYSEKGSQIWFQAAQAGDEIVVRVRDTGIGIPADKLPNIFDIFMQVDRSLERSQGGLGIGLTLVRQLVQMHGGSVEVLSDGPGRGSEFVVRLPVVIVAKPDGQNKSEIKTNERATEARRILIADDNRDSADSLAMLLEMLGHEVSLAHDGLEALETAKSSKPELIFMDLGMPRMNGYDAARLIRNAPECNGVVLVALTGWGQEEDRRRSLEAGFDHHIVKPIDFAVVEKLITDLNGSR